MNWIKLGLYFIWGLGLVPGSATSKDLATNVKEKQYPVSSIPATLLVGANAVVREDQRTFEVHNIANGTYTRKLVVTILNEKAQKYGYFYNPYFGKSGLSQFSGTVFDALGNEIDKIKKSDLEDRSSFDGFSIYSDSRYESIAYTYHNYPYTIAYEYTERYDGLMSYPGWNPLWATRMSVEKSSYTVVVPSNIGIRYKEINLSDTLRLEDNGELESYKWSAEALSPVSTDALGPNWSDLTPKVLVGPNEFKFGGYAGDMRTWESYGKWQSLVNEELGTVSSVTTSAIQSILKDAHDDRDKVRMIYKYLQKNTRYVSVQLGIGGWQPYAPSYVEDYGFGDCKALSFYTKSILSAVGIESLYTLVNAGAEKKKIHTDFPSNQFNHVFLCVPMQMDTIWLECTSQTNPFGYLGTFTSDRPVLLITDEGGKMVRTPALTKRQNQKSTNAKVVIDDEGNAIAKLITEYGGYFFERINHNVLPKGPEDQKKWLYKNLDLPSFKINQLEFRASGESAPIVTQTLDISVRKKASVSGKRLFLQPSLLNRITTIPDAIDDRKTAIVINYNRVWSDTIEYSLPDKFHPEYIPEAVKLESEFGNYSMEVVQGAGTIRYIRKLEMEKGEYEPKLYGAYRNFIEQVVKADKAKIVLKNTT